jgi:hypothetical protein
VSITLETCSASLLSISIIMYSHIVSFCPSATISTIMGHVFTTKGLSETTPGEFYSRQRALSLLSVRSYSFFLPPDISVCFVLLQQRR